MAGRKPDFRIAVLDKRTDKNGRLGAAWKNDDGSISLVVDPGCQLVYNPDFIYSLFPNDNGPRE